MMHKIVNKLIIQICSVRLSRNLKNEILMCCKPKTPRDFATSLIGSVMERVKLMVSRFLRFNFPYLEDMS